jgi:hypothetical protein
MYTIEIPIISLSENWKFKHITTHHQKELCKSLFEEDNYILINSIINEIITQCLHPSHCIHKLTILDKLIILLRLRSISIGSSIDIVIQKDSKKINFNYDFNNILENIFKVYKNIQPLIISKNNIKLACYIPYIKWENNIITDNLINYYIRNITVYNTDLDFINLNTADQTSILDKLPADIIHSINSYVQDLYKKLSEVFLYKVLEDCLPLTITGDTIFEYIKFIFKDNLHNIYYDIYNLNTHLNFDSNYIENLSPVEREMYITFFKKENQKQSTSTAPVSQPIGDINEGINERSIIDTLDTFKQMKGG